jgi:hypothetical protein
MFQVTLKDYFNASHTFTISTGVKKDQIRLCEYQGRLVQFGYADDEPEGTESVALLAYELESVDGKIERLEMELTAYIGQSLSRTSGVYTVSRTGSTYRCEAQFVRYGGPFGEEYLNNDLDQDELDSILNLVNNLETKD